MITKQREDHEPSQEHIAKMKAEIRQKNEQAMRNRGRHHRELEIGPIRECRLGVEERE